jgi:2-oxo-4-hydroxy-4-carboxy-5-ureidoimidazoline decarboxylase
LPSMLDEFNVLPASGARDALLAVCASNAWTTRVVAARPYRSERQLRDVADAAFASLAWDDIEEALGAHPRIGERPAGVSTEASWSRQEQARVAPGHDLVAVNRAYEERFGRIFLIYAAAKTAEQILDAAKRRLDNDEETERGVVREELRKIVHLRLHRLLGA